jgi:hypothetical protein
VFDYWHVFGGGHVSLAHLLNIELVENLNLDLRFFASNHLPPKEIVPKFPFYKLETHHVVDCTHMQETNTSWLDCKFMKFLWG